MSIKISNLQFFVAVATSQSLTQAAQRLHRTPAAVSLSLKQLEEELGGALFEGERKNQLSPLGRFVLLEAQRELAHFDRTISTIKTYAKAETGLVRVAAVPSFAITLLPPLLKQFHEQHPQFHLDIRDMDSERVVQAVLSGDVDIGIGTVPASIPNIDQDFLFSDAFCVVCASYNPLNRLARPLRWSDLDGQNFINSGLGAEINAAEFRHIRDHSTLSVRNTTSLLALVAQGMGVTLLPELLSRSAAGDQLNFLRLEDQRIVRSVSVITAPRETLNHASYTFLKALKGSRFA
ncbi:LysR family transcriptional regulator [Pseudomonas protegens]|uniref:LysR family transcriptional regulator n=1 Tax=Pseudomonas protegens TaxID=380021 RepID=UPI0014761A55|nr:LysR family transcriptional regulator [Pseudomonas protegens]MBF0638653.1 LysR family transcriptional regulator [Pseudomonas protegens]NMZ31723.1 LysR family transcriptional regulator [Pseudomonas protegens]NMZ89306.1 LysR family transcriptional regulator [Pseudomonas protegens]